MTTATQDGYAKDSWQTPRNARTLRAYMALRNQEIGGRLRELRGEKPQTAVADELGVAERTYQGWEAGETKPSYRNLQRLADYYRVREEFILTGTSDTPSPFPADPETADERWARLEAAVEAHADIIRALLEQQSAILERIEAAVTADTAIRDEISDLIQRRGQEIVEPAPHAVDEPDPKPVPAPPAAASKSPAAKPRSR
jgi:transcriptional regulator with XRE-family HTH domain